MSKKKNSGGRFLLVVLVLVAAGIVWAQQTGRIFATAEGPEIEGAPVRRGPLEITVTERGNLTAKSSVSMKSEMEGRSTVLYLIPEGTRVEAGDLVAELDAAEMVDRKVAQEISVQSARAAETKAREGLEIQKIENESQIARAKQDVEFARTDLDKFLGEDPPLSEELVAEIRELLASSKVVVEPARSVETPLEAAALGAGDELVEPPTEVPTEVPSEGAVVEQPEPVAEDTIFEGGDRQQQFLKSQEDIQVAQEELKRAQETLNWSRDLFKRGFIAETELEADELTAKRSEIKLDQSRRALYLLGIYEHPKQLSSLEGALEEAKRQLRKAEKQAIAQLADYEASLASAKVKLELEEQKLAKLTEQIGKARLIAPVAGMIVYGRTEGHRGMGGEPVQEGGEVRERQEIASIPGAGGMIAQASVHESVLKQVVAGLPVEVSVDALPGRTFLGVVGHVAQLPDPNSWFANPNQRLYRTEIVIDESGEDMRPGMSCSIEILVETIPDAIYVPLQAVFYSGGRNLAWVKNDDGIEERTVEIGSHNQKWVTIESGLEEGEIVLLSSPPGFQPQESGIEEGEDLERVWTDLPEDLQMPSGNAGSRRGGELGEPGQRGDGNTDSGDRRSRMGGQGPAGMEGRQRPEGAGGERGGSGERRMRPEGGASGERGSRQRPEGRTPGSGGRGRGQDNSGGSGRDS